MQNVSLRRALEATFKELIEVHNKLLQRNAQDIQRAETVLCNSITVLPLVIFYSIMNHS